jgi:hypothetical protein
VAFARLLDRGLEDVIYPTPLVQYAIRQVRGGRCVGGKLNANDVSAEYCQRRKQFALTALDQYDEEQEQWKEELVEDKHAGPAETAASRLDFADWLRGLPKRLRRIAEALATGETTQTATRQFRFCPGRISQLRRELQQAWESFQGEREFA